MNEDLTTVDSSSPVPVDVPAPTGAEPAEADDVASMDLSSLEDPGEIPPALLAELDFGAVERLRAAGLELAFTGRGRGLSVELISTATGERRPMSLAAALELAGSLPDA